MGKLDLIKRAQTALSTAGKGTSEAAAARVEALWARIGSLKGKSAAEFTQWLGRNAFNIAVALDIGAEVYGFFSGSAEEREKDVKRIQKSENPAQELILVLEERKYDTDDARSDKKTKSGLEVDKAIAQQSEVVARAHMVLNVMNILALNAEQLLELRRVVAMDPDDLALALDLNERMRG